jgi:peroxiredoxin family protein
MLCSNISVWIDQAGLKGVEIMSEKFAIILESGTMDKLMAASILTAGAAAMGKDVTVFLTFGGLNAFKKGAAQAMPVMPNEFKGMEDTMGQIMQAKKVPHWLENFKSAKEVGNLKVLACSATMEMFDMKLGDLEPIVEEVVGVAHFIQESEGAQTLFI